MGCLVGDLVGEVGVGVDGILVGRLVGDVDGEALGENVGLDVGLFETRVKFESKLPGLMNATIVPLEFLSISFWRVPLFMMLLSAVVVELNICTSQLSQLCVTLSVKSTLLRFPSTNRLAVPLKGR